MSLRRVRYYGDPALKSRAREITEFDASLADLAADMRETMKAYNGVGLAANQIGVLQRILVVDVPQPDGPRATYTLVNPVIVFREGQEKGEEGCLSIPGVWDEVVRAKRIHVRAQDETGKPIEVDAEGYFARAIQHEVDHLDGVLFVDRLSLLKRQFLRRDLEAIARGELPEDQQPPQEASGG